jgi:glucosamine--fructose-6-phosphate aminotransferase (isomerizing)
LCNIAGYVGSERAAPILIQMMKKQEGFYGGYYTGIATIENGKIYHVKVVGDISQLLKEKDVEHLPGTIGIIHSRSNSGGKNERWAHPFLSCDKKIAYVANGIRGAFHDVVDINLIAQRLEDEGHTYDSKTIGKISNYPFLKDGTSVHSSEVMCHLIGSFLKKSNDPVDAIKEAFINLPGEIVGLMLSTALPDSIIVSRISQPLMIGHSSKSTYLATTAMAFPKDKGIYSIYQMPVYAAAKVSSNLTSIVPFEQHPKEINLTIPWDLAYEKIIDLFSKNDKKYYLLSDLAKATSDIWPTKLIPQKYMAIYEVLRTLYDYGKIDYKYIKTDGVIPGSKIVQNAIYYASKK